MTGAEKGFLLLTSRLGNPERKILTLPQLRVLGQRIRDAVMPVDDRELELSDLTALGYGRDLAWVTSAPPAVGGLSAHLSCSG